MEVTSSCVQTGNKVRVKKRGNLPREATKILHKWLASHIYRPYPTDEEKIRLVNETKLTLLQISNWLINSRRRVLPAMIRKGGKDFCINKKVQKQTDTSPKESDKLSSQPYPGASVEEKPISEAAGAYSKSDTKKRLVSSKSCNGKLLSQENTLSTNGIKKTIFRPRMKAETERVMSFVVDTLNMNPNDVWSSMKILAHTACVVQKLEQRCIQKS